MSSDNDDARLIEAAITWNVPALIRAGGRAEVFLEVMNLHPQVFEDDRRINVEQQNTALAVAAEGLKFELTGRIDEARARYLHLSDSSFQMDRILGTLLNAWLQDSTEADMDQVKHEVAKQRRSLKANIYTKLAIWALQRGWKEYAGKTYDEAVQLTSKVRRINLLSFGHHFGRQRVVQFGGPNFKPNDDYPWIQEILGFTSEDAIIAAVAERFRSLSTTSWRFGGPAGSRVQAATMQADWAGAYWLLLRGKQVHAALLFDKMDDQGVDVSEALALWAESGGGHVEEIARGVERLLTHETVDQLMTQRLARGSRLPQNSYWISLCAALWDELPHEIARELVEKVQLPDEWQRGSNSEVFSLFAVLYLHDRDPWARRFLRLSASQQGGVLLNMSPGVATQLPLDCLREGVVGAFASLESNADGRVFAGIGTLAAAVQMLDESVLTSRFLDLVPADALPAVAIKYEGLIPEQRIERQQMVLLDQLREQLNSAISGAFAIPVYDSAVSAAQTMAVLETVNQELLDAIVEVSTSRFSSSQQARSALIALDLCAAVGLLDESILSRIGDSRDPARAGGMWEGPADLRLEQIERAALFSRFDESRMLDVVAAGRDPIAAVRSRALRTAVLLAERRRSPALDSAFLGAIYDPEPAIQTWGVRALTRGLVEDVLVAKIGWARLLEQWNTADRTVRIAIARGITTSELVNWPDVVRELYERAHQDRSLVVRGETANTARIVP